MHKPGAPGPQPAVNSLWFSRRRHRSPRATHTGLAGAKILQPAPRKVEKVGRDPCVLLVKEFWGEGESKPPLPPAPFWLPT